MADIVSSLFGLNPNEIVALRQKEDQANAFQYGKGQRNPGAATTGYGFGAGLSRGLMSGLGIQDPALEKATKLQQILSDAQSELGPDVNDQAKLLSTVQQKLAQDPRFAQEALQVGAMAQKAAQEQSLGQAKLATEKAQLTKAQTDAQIKQNELQDAANFKKDLGTLDPTSPTYDTELKQLTLKYATPDKLFATLQTSEDKAAYRDFALNQLQLATKARMDLADKNNASDIEKEKIKLEGKALADAIKANATGNPKINANEKLIANTMTTALAEAGVATDNLSNLTSKGTVYTSAGAFNNLSDEGIFGASAKAMTRAMTPQDKAMYESVMLPLVRQVVTIQSGGRYKITEGAVKQEMQAIMTQAGQSHETMLAKMGEIKQTIAKSAEAALASGALNPEQKQLVEDNLLKIDKAIPWEVNDVINFVHGGGKGKNFKTWLDSTKVSFTPTKPLSPDQEAKMSKTIEAIGSGKISKDAGKALLKKYGIEVN